MHDGERKELSFSTRAVHPVEPESTDGVRPHAPPIYQTSTFLFDNVEQGARRFAGEEEGYIYSRLGNPTTRILEMTGADLENAEDGAAFASGMGAISAVLLQLLSAGDHLVAGRTLYGCTYSLMQGILPRMGVQVTFVDATDITAVKEAVRPETRVLYAETPANPSMDLVDLEAFAALGRETGATTVVDNTFMSPYLQRPLDWGIDVSVHSATKYIGGHGDVVAGLAFSSADLVAEVKEEALKDIGAILGPFDAWLLIRGLKTLPLRMEKHSTNAQTIAEWLQEHPRVSRVRYPGLPSHPQHQLARRQNPRGLYGGMLSLEMEGGFEAGRQLLDRVRLCTLAVSLGATDTLIEHPASMTHSTIDEKDQRAVGISPGLVRMSVGVEDCDDLLSDLEQAMRGL